MVKRDPRVLGRGRRRALNRAIASAFAGLLVAPAAATAQLEPRAYVTGLSLPVAFLADPTSASRQFVVEQGGRIRTIVGGVLQATDFLDLTGTVSPAGGERGLLGMALAPDYAASGRLFVYFTRRAAGADDGDIVVARYLRSASNPAIADPSTRFDLGWISLGNQRYIEHSTFSNHNGGAIVFGPDGYLYVGVGDGGGGDDPLNSGQSATTLLGKILRIDVNVPPSDANGYRIPADNPFVDNTPVDAFEEIWAFGVRNPWRFSFDLPAHGGDMFLGDVGQSDWEEINHAPPGAGGRNYGWRFREGAHDHVTTTPPAYLPLTDPVLEYPHTNGVNLVEGRSVTGGIVYRGEDLGARFQGRYFWADFVLGRVWSAAVAKTGGTAELSDIIDHTPHLQAGQISSFGVDQQNEMYLVSYGHGTIYRIGLPCTYAVTVSTTSFSRLGGTGIAQLATQTGCSWQALSMDGWITLVPGAGVGAGRVTFRVSANPEAVMRTGAVTLNTVRIAVAQSALAPPLGDFNGSGTGDLLWQHDDGRLAIWLMQGSNLLAGEPLGPGSTGDPQWRLAAGGDMDGDGSRDAIFQHSGNGQLAVWLMSGHHQLAGIPVTPGAVEDVNWKIRAAADMNRDGWTDLLWHHQVTGELAIWFMEGSVLRDGRLLSPSSVPDTSWQVVGAADVDQDGYPDILWHHRTLGLVAVWYMAGSTLRSGELTSPDRVADTGWTLRAVADLNNDGNPDLIWQHVVDGRLAVWFMNGAAQISGTLLLPPQVTDSGWRIVGA
jgi:glucose/arabinose dehydrogenase